jgi:ribonucleoside-diphosphate reductase alpha chain
MEAKMFDEKEVKEATLEYFGGDELATNVFMTKYCLRDKKGNFREKTPDDMHRRLASEFARMETKFNTEEANSLTEEEIYGFLSDFKYIVPQGSPMMGVGNDYLNVSLSNCVVVDDPETIFLRLWMPARTSLIFSRGAAAWALTLVVYARNME